jgi:hypothetical protein
VARYWFKQNGQCLFGCWMDVLGANLTMDGMKLIHDEAEGVSLDFLASLKCS